jgi:hypothetical protein
MKARMQASGEAAVKRGREGAGRMFFFEKKNQKTFYRWGSDLRRRRMIMITERKRRGSAAR